MQKQNDLALNLKNLFSEGSYQEFSKRFFVNRPDMYGYFYIFKNITNPRFCLIINMSEDIYNTNMTKIRDYVYMIYNVKSLEEFIENLTIKYLPLMLETIDQNLQKQNTRNLPYGYYYDENGDLKIDLKKANEVKKIYDRYIETESVREIANERKTNFSHVRDILHDNEEYMRMQPKILPMTTLKQINDLLAKNVKGTFRKRTMSDKVKEAKQKRKELNRSMQMR